ncbi:MAG: RNA polymerase sigma factor [Ruminococcus sp.]|nr:RNA polymerase sigma factor [Ruminococcus sp.]
MDDAQIVALFEMRDEQAITETTRKYEQMCRRIADDILHNEQDANECVNDAMLRVWKTIPPQKPRNLAAYLTTIIQNLAYDRLKFNLRHKRNNGQLPLILDELSECIAASDSIENDMDEHLLDELLARFLDTLSYEHRTVFVMRYMACAPICEIAAMYQLSESKVKISLYRTRKRLKRVLQQEGWI